MLHEEHMKLGNDPRTTKNVICGMSCVAKLMEFDLAHNDWRSVLTIEFMYARFCAPTST